MEMVYVTMICSAMYYIQVLLLFASKNNFWVLIDTDDYIHDGIGIKHVLQT